MAQDGVPRVKSEACGPEMLGAARAFKAYVYEAVCAAPRVVSEKKRLEGDKMEFVEPV